MLLAQSGEVGRAWANRLMFKMLSEWALDDTYKDLSNKVSSEVMWSRMEFDRPPGGHQHLIWWRWHRLETLGPKVKHWGPRSGPQGRFDVHTGPGGTPLPPPQCWGGAYQ